MISIMFFVSLILWLVLRDNEDEKSKKIADVAFQFIKWIGIFYSIIFLLFMAYIIMCMFATLIPFALL